MLGRCLESLDEFALLEDSSIDNFETLEGCTFLPQKFRVRRHRARRYSTNVSVVAAVGHEENWFLLIRIEDRSDDGQIR